MVFKTRLKIPGPDGQIMHSELEYEDGLIFVGQACPDEKKTSPQTLDGAMTSGLYIYVDDVDAHCEHARAAGATIVKESEDMFYGDRNYTAKDPEGHHWVFRPTHPRRHRRGMPANDGANVKRRVSYWATRATQALPASRRLFPNRA